jgi:hypothetical protein
MADRGDFLLAVATAEKVRPRLAGPTPGLDRFVRVLCGRHERFREAVAKLTDAADARDWRQAASWADEVIAVAPNHRDARHAQMRAWDIIGEGPSTGSSRVPFGPQPETLPYVPANGEREALAAPHWAGSAAAAHAVTKTAPPAGPAGTPQPAAVAAPAPSLAGGVLPKRFLLWVDGVGGYLVCLGTRVTFGQATADGPIDVPLFADVSRLHAEVSRDGEGYVLESTRGVQVNGSAAARAVLKCGDRVTLGTTCQFLFRQPVPISPSARLELVSGHRLPLAVDGVLLMADNLILGPGGQAHVCVPWVPGSVILYRSKDGIGVRFAGGEFRIDNKPCRDRAALPLPSVVTADAFTFAVEPVGTRL